MKTPDLSSYFDPDLHAGAVGAWIPIDPRFELEQLGRLPELLRADDPRPVREQLNDRYAHGGGWRPQSGFNKSPGHTLHYPGDPPMHPIAVSHFGNEVVIFYPHGYLLVMQLDHSWEVCRVD